jgi:nicotinate phosphoribosyltransferase
LWGRLAACGRLSAGQKSSRVNGLLTDLYELTMATGYYDAGKAHQKATFELTIRRLPAHRNFVIAAGLQQAIDYLLNLAFAPE